MADQKNSALYTLLGGRYRRCGDCRLSSFQWWLFCDFILTSNNMEMLAIQTRTPCVMSDPAVDLLMSCIWRGGIQFFGGRTGRYLPHNLL